MEDKVECAYKMDISFAEYSRILIENTEKLVGEILTVLEIIDLTEVQEKAVKSMVKQAIWRFCNVMKSNLEPKNKQLEV